MSVVKVKVLENIILKRSVEDDHQQQPLDDAPMEATAKKPRSEEDQPEQESPSSSLVPLPLNIVTQTSDELLEGLNFLDCASTIKYVPLRDLDQSELYPVIYYRWQLVKNGLNKIKKMVVDLVDKDGSNFSVYLPERFNVRYALHEDLTFLMTTQYLMGYNGLKKGNSGRFYHDITFCKAKY